MIKTLLINPPWYRFFGGLFFDYPKGLCYIAAVLENRGFDVSVYNADYNKDNLDKPIFGDDDLLKKETHDKYAKILDDIDHPLWKEIEDVISKQSPDVVGISSMSTQYGPALNIAKIVKGLDSDIPVVFGGVHPTVLPEETIRNKDVDIVVRSEGEYTFLDFVEKVESGESLRDIPGITYKEKDKIIHNPERPLIRNLDELPFPARHLLLDKEDYIPGIFSRIVVSRGCPYNCIFCASRKIWRNKVRYRSPENVIEEIKYVYKTFVSPSFFFDDADFLINKKFVLSLCDLLIEEGLIINWCCQARADEIDRNIVSKMALAGCTMIEVGVESGSNEILRRVKKGITIEQVREARRILAENFIDFDAFFMIGFPWETKQDIERTMEFMKELDPDTASFFNVIPYPGTELYDMYKEETESIDWRYLLFKGPEFHLNKNITKEDVFQLIKCANKLEKQVFFASVNKSSVRLI
jgi:radical SAM superfamily enzyme YgiQ (UPF0313 family)